MSTVRTIDGAGWDCKACGACCRDFALGPVKPSIIEGLQALRIGDDHAPAAGGFAHREPGPDGEPAWYLDRREDGACIFLLEDRRCAVHALHGPEAKPAFCREYPFQAVRDGQGTAVTVRQDCCGAWRTFDEGTPQADQVADVLGLERAYELGAFSMEVVPVLPAVAVGPEDWLWLEGTLLEALEPDQPEVVNDRVRALLFKSLRREPPTPDTYRADAATAHVLRAVHRALGAAVGGPPAEDPATRGMRAFLTSVHETLDQALVDLPGDDLLDDRAQRYVDVVLRSQLLSKAFQPIGSVPAWLGLHLLGTRLARAHATTDGPLGPADVGPPLATWIRFTRHRAAQQLLKDLRPALVDLFLYAD